MTFVDAQVGVTLVIRYDDEEVGLYLGVRIGRSLVSFEFGNGFSLLEWPPGGNFCGQVSDDLGMFFC